MFSGVRSYADRHVCKTWDERFAGLREWRQILNRHCVG